MRSQLLFIVFVLIFAAFGMLPDVQAQNAYAQGPAALSDPGARKAPGASGTGLVPVEPDIDGGTVPIGSSSQVVIRFRNEGSLPVETGVIRLYPSSNVAAETSLNQCQETPLTAGAECAVALSVKGLQAGAWRVEVLMSHSGRSRLVSATLSGTVEAGEGAESLSLDLESVPESVDFGSLNANQTLVEPVILRNITSNPIEIEDIYVDASERAGYSLRTECDRLEPGQSCIATVTWSPKLKGPSTGVLVIKHTGPTALTSVIIEGEYSPDSVDQAELFPEAIPGKGLLVSSQTEVNFGSGIQTASTITVSLVNAGDADLNIKDIQISGSDNGLSFRGEGCKAGTVLEPIEACPLTVYWAPTRTGALLDDIQIIHDGARGILVLPVRGQADNPVSQDQGSIMLSGGQDSGGREYEYIEIEEEVTDEPPGGTQSRGARKNVRRTSFTPGLPNPSAVLDGLKITSFSPTRAIINGPSGSRIVFDQEPIVLGGIPWDVNIQRNGIEFTHRGQTVLLLFDRSLSSVNRIQSQSGSGRSVSSGSRSSSSSGSSASTSSSSGIVTPGSGI